MTSGFLQLESTITSQHVKESKEAPIGFTFTGNNLELSNYCPITARVVYRRK
jgi:hypothetical protein